VPMLVSASRLLILKQSRGVGHSMFGYIPLQDHEIALSEEHYDAIWGLDGQHFEWSPRRVS
jgi:hypothetical protein